MGDERKKVIDERCNERFHMFPQERIESIAMITGTIGGFSGFYEGIKTSSLRYLTENSHRLPKTVGGWYFYHKKKNYVMITQGLKLGMKQGFKYSFFVSIFFTTEALIDHIRGQIDLFNSTINSTAFFTGYGLHKKLSRQQVINYGKRGFIFGLSLGFCQDLMIWIRGGKVWYIDALGIKNPRYEAVESGTL